MIVLRELEHEDYFRGYLQLLSQLSIIDYENIKYEEFVQQYYKTKNKIYVLHDKSTNKIIGSGSILLEYKFIRDLGCVGHIEDIVVDKDYRGNNYGKIIIDKLLEISEENKCYKVILDCDNKMINYYKNMGFDNKGLYMAKYK